jgi:hypothetical protein
VQHALLQQGIEQKVDYLFHGDELPQGMLMEVNPNLLPIIHEAIRKLKIVQTAEDEQHITLERLYDLARAYKFWFNPNRLIDATMVLQQRLAQNPGSDMNDLTVFFHAMVRLYEQLTTTECMDLYGYFANKDTRYLLYLLFLIKEGETLDWLPVVHEREKKAIDRVFQALKNVMEALREALKNRSIVTEPFVYDLEKNKTHAGKRNREAIHRILTLYGEDRPRSHTRINELFDCISS